MSKANTYQVKIAEQTYSLQTEDADALDVIALKNGTYHILKDGHSYEATIVETDFDKKELTIAVNGNKYQLQIKDHYDLLVQKMGLSAGGAKKLKNVKAPMPGLVLDILVKKGQKIDKEDQLLILEAMKMENVLKAEGEGTIKSITVKKGDAVDKGQVLIEME